MSPKISNKVTLRRVVAPWLAGLLACVLALLSVVAVPEASATDTDTDADTDVDVLEYYDDEGNLVFSLTETDNSDGSARATTLGVSDITGPMAGTGARTGMGYEWYDNVNGVTTHWLGAFDLGNGLEWCINLNALTPSGSGTAQGTPDQEFIGATPGSSYEAYFEVTAEQMAWILYKYQDTNTAVSRAAIATLIHVNFEEEVGLEVGRRLFYDVYHYAPEIREKMVDYVAEAKEATADESAQISVGVTELQRVQVSNVGITNNVTGEWQSGRDFTLTITGPGKWESVSGYTVSEDGKTLSGTTGSSALSFWIESTATGEITVSSSYDTSGTWSIVKLGRTASQSTIRYNGYTHTDPMFKQSSSVYLVYDFQPMLTSSAEYVQKGDTLSDELFVYPDPSYHGGAWAKVNDENVTVLFEGTAYYLGDERPESSSASVPDDAVVVATATLEASKAGTYEATANVEAEQSGYITWVWRVSKESNERYTYKLGDQTFTSSDLIHADWQDYYNLDAETPYRIVEFQPVLTSSVEDCKVNDRATGDEVQLVCDSLTVYTDPDYNEGVWPAPMGVPVSVTFEGTAYYVGENPASVSDTVPAGLAVAATAELTVTGAGTYEVEAELLGDYDPSFINWVWRVSKTTNEANLVYINQDANGDPVTATSADFIASDWQDQFGLEDETLVNRWEAHVVSSISFRETADGTFLVDDLWVTGLPSDHGDWAGTCESSTDTATCFNGDVASFTQTLYFFPQGVEVSEANKSKATVVGSIEVAATNGFHATLGSTEWLWPQDENGNNLDGTVVFQTSFPGDDRVAPYLSDITDETEQITSYTPDMASLATNGEGGKIVSGDGDATITDRVTITDLEAGVEYTLVGVLADAATGETLTGAGTRSETTFTAEGDSREVTQTFTVNAGLLAEETVVFEYLYKNGDLVVSETTADNEAQTVYRPSLDSVLLDDLDGDKYVASTGEVTLVDTVSYANLEVGETYLLVGKLVDGETGKVLTDLDGQAISVQQELEATDLTGSVQQVFTIEDASILEGRSVVAFEYVYTVEDQSWFETLVDTVTGWFTGSDLPAGAVLFASHEDINDADQTVYSSLIGSTATDGADGDKTITATAEATLVDTVSYSNLSTEVEYTLTGTLMVKSTGEPLVDADGNEVTSSMVFTPEETSGVVDVVFTFDASALASDMVVVFEDLYQEETLIAVHENIDDADQTVGFEAEDSDAGAAAQDSDELAVTGAPGIIGLTILAILVFGAGGTLLWANHKTRGSVNPDADSMRLGE